MKDAEALASIVSAAVDACSRAWDGLGTVAEGLLGDATGPVALLPFVSAKACGGGEATAVELAASILLDATSLRILDDCADQDNPLALYLTVGPATAVNTAMALAEVATRTLSLLRIPKDRLQALVSAHSTAKLAVLQGQQADLGQEPGDLPGYEAIVAAKTVAAFEFATRAGGLAATDDRALHESLGQAGRHFGWMTQILDDIEELWFPDAPTDRVPIGYPLFWAGSDGEVPATRLELCRQLDAMAARPALLARALDHRDAVLEAMGPPLAPAAGETLESILDWVFRDGQSLMDRQPTGS